MRSQSVNMSFGQSIGRVDRRGVIIAVAVVVVAAFVVGGIWAFSGSSSAAKARSTTAAVKRGTITVTASASGTIASVNERALTFGTGGTVATLTVKAGQAVTAGQTLATLDPTDAQASVDQAQSALDAANTNLALAEEQAASPSPTATATGCSGRAAEAAYIVAKPKPSKSPSPSPSTSPSPSPSPSASVTPTRSSPPKPPKTTAPAPTHSKASGCPSSTSGSGTGSGGTTGNGPGGGGNANSGTDSLLRAEQAVNNDELTLEQAQAALAGTTIVAPISGRVISVSGSVGAKASAGGSGFIVLSGASSIAVEASFSEADVAPIKVGQSASVTLANHAGTSYKATVTQIDPAGTTSGSLVEYGVQLTFVAAPSNLLLGQSADVSVTTASAPDVLYVPSAAITTAADGTSTVKVKTLTGTETRTVTTGLDGDQGTEIKTGLTDSDTVIVP